MFSIPAAITTSIVVCRSFISLSDYLSKKDVWVLPSARVGFSGVTGSGVSHGSPAKKKRGMAGIIFHSIAEGINSMGEAHNMGEFDASRTTTTLSIGRSRRRDDYGGANENSGPVIHMVDLERSESTLGKMNVASTCEEA